MQDHNHLRGGAVPAETCKVSRTQCYAVNIRHHHRCPCIACSVSTAQAPASLLVVPAKPVPWRRRPLPQVALVPGRLREKGVLGSLPGAPAAHFGLWSTGCGGVFSWAFQRSNPKSGKTHVPFSSTWICGSGLSSSQEKVLQT